MVYGMGIESCGKWTSEPQPILRGTSLSWVLGFISGVGAVVPGVKHTDTDAIRAWMDQYCATHPLETVAEAAADLVKALRDSKARPEESR
jgi:hypothetical protein